MTQEHSRRGGLEPDTSERLYTADDLASYTASRLRPEAPLPAPPHGDPLTDPMPEQPIERCARALADPTFQRAVETVLDELV